MNVPNKAWSYRKLLTCVDSTQKQIQLNRAKERGETWIHVYIESTLGFNTVRRVGPDSWEVSANSSLRSTDVVYDMADMRLCCLVANGLTWTTALVSPRCTGIRSRRRKRMSLV